MAVWQARELGLDNFSILCSHVLVPPAMKAILGSADNQVQGFLAAGHVCTVMGYWEYGPIAERYLLHGTYMALRALEEGRWGVENQYARSVSREGNEPAQNLLRDVFRVTDRAWRGIGSIPDSGFELSERFSGFDATRRFEVGTVTAQESSECIAGEILKGRTKPHDCPAFGTRCTPDHPLGAPMVSSEGACAAYYAYGRFEGSATLDLESAND